MLISSSEHGVIKTAMTRFTDNGGSVLAADFDNGWMKLNTTSTGSQLQKL